MALLTLANAGCTAAPKPIEHAVAPRSPSTLTHKSDEPPRPADEHAAALEQLTLAELGTRFDKQKSIGVALPDSKSWRRVRFLGMKSLVGFRYGVDHHAVIGAFVLNVPNRTIDSCHKAFKEWAEPALSAFEVRYELEAPVGFTWRNTLRPTEPVEVMSAVTLRASVSSVLINESYHAAYAIYPAWPDKCLVVGIGVPDQGEGARAKKARDRFAQEAFSQLEIASESAPTKEY